MFLFAQLVSSFSPQLRHHFSRQTPDHPLNCCKGLALIDPCSVFNYSLDSMFLCLMRGFPSRLSSS